MSARGWVPAALAVLVACGAGKVTRVEPQLQPPASPVDFGTVPVLNEKQVQVPLVNLGRASLTVSSVALADPDGGVFRVISAPPQVESGATENLVVAFVPPGEQAYSATLNLETDDPATPSLALALTGIGSTRAAVRAAPLALDFGRVGECTSALAQLTVQSSGTADLILQDIAFAAGTSPAFAFVGSTRTPATVKAGAQIQLTVKVTAAAGGSGPLAGDLALSTTDPDHPRLLIPLSASINRAPVASIAALGNAAPGQLVTLDGSASADPDGDAPLSYRWTLRSKPLASATTLATPAAASTAMTLDPTVPGAYDVQLDVTDATGVKSCAPAMTTVVAAPAQKLLVELFWDNAGTDLDLHVLRSPTATLGQAPDDCFYQDRAPDWGQPGPADDPLLVRDALTGYGPELFGYVNPVPSTYRITVVFANGLLSPTPASTATVRVYQYGVLKTEVQRQLLKAGDLWPVADVSWPSGDVAVLP